MRFRLLLALPLLALSAFPASPVRGQSSGLSYLEIAPYEGHSGDTLYVTGAGLSADKSQLITIACPDALNAGANYESVPGPKSDAQGRFVAFPVHAPIPSDLTTPMPCTIYVEVGAQYFGPDIRGHYIIVPPHQRLNPCAVRICGIHVSSQPVHARNGLTEQIAVRDPGWPGASVTVGLQYNGGADRLQPVRLDYHGATSLRWPVQIPLKAHVKSLRVAVHVRLELGGIAGTGSAQFMVLHVPPAVPRYFVGHMRGE